MTRSTSWVPFNCKGSPSNDITLAGHEKRQRKSGGQSLSGSNLAMLVVAQRYRPGTLQFTEKGASILVPSAMSDPRAITGREKTTVIACRPLSRTGDLLVKSDAGVVTRGFNGSFSSRNFAGTWATANWAAVKRSRTWVRATMAQTAYEHCSSSCISGYAPNNRGNRGSRAATTDITVCAWQMLQCNSCFRNSVLGRRDCSEATLQH